MSWRERRLITVLTVILLLLTAAVVLVLSMRYQEGRAAKEASAPADIVSDPATDPNAPVTLAYSNGATSLSFLREESGAWYWEADKTFPLDDAVISEILELMAAWEPQQTLTDAETLENSGLGEPSGSITVTTASGGVTELLFGKTTDDGTSYYVRRNGDESTVYIIADTLFQRMKVPIYDMCVLPELPVLEETDIRSVTIRGADKAEGEETTPGIITTFTAKQAEKNGGTSWNTGGVDVSADPAVRSLVEDLTTLAFTKCIDYNPSDEAASICGFDAPAAVLMIGYTAEDKSDQTLRLTIGNRLPDGSGRYTRLGDDPTIYLLTTDLLDPLMQLAAEGLAG